MSFNINTFKATGLFGGGARPSLFEVRMTGVPVTTAGGTTARLSFLAQAASLPPSTIELVEVPYFGRRVRLAGERIFNDWTITVMNDEDFQLRDLFESWSNKMNSMVSNRQQSSASNLLDYKVDSVEVLQYGKIGPDNDSGVTRSYMFSGLFPIKVEAIPLDWSRGNQIETYDVTFALDYWIPTTIGTSVPTYSGYTPPDTGSLGVTAVLPG